MQINSFNSKIFVDSFLGGYLNEILQALKPSKIVVLVDDKTQKYCFPQLYKLISKEKVYVKNIKQGERNKSIETVTEIWNFLQKKGCDRNTLMINLGGGIILDIGGFAASTFKRGFPFINIPTTLLSMVDASIGGKTGFNLNDYKNHIGLFSQPYSVLVNARFLSTLESRQIYSGWAEMIKHGLIRDENHLSRLLRTKPGDVDQILFNDLIGDSIRIKNYFVEKDPYEKDIRKALNFGHTVGHAIESYMVSKEPLLHGEAISIGMICELYLSRIKAKFPEQKERLVSSYLFNHFPKVDIVEEEYESIIRFMRQDKKNQAEKISFTLLEDEGKPILDQYLSESDIMESLEYYNSLADVKG